MWGQKSWQPIAQLKPALIMRPALAALDQTLNRLYLLCGVVAASAIVAIAVLVALSILTRLAGVYVGGLTEGAGYAMAAAGTFGLAYTFGAGGHIRVDLVLNLLPGKSRFSIELLSLVVTTGVILFLTYYVIRMVSISWKFGDLSDGSDELPLWLPQLPAAIGFTVFALALCHHLVRYVFTRKITWASDERSLLDDTQGD